MFLRLLSRRSRPIGRLAVASSVAFAAALAVGVAPAAADSSCPTPSPGATGDVCSYTLTPSSFQAGSAPNISSTIDFDYQGSSTDSVESLTVTLPAGLFASLGAVGQVCTPAELSATVPACPPGSQVGTGSLTSSLDPSLVLQVVLFLMPPPQPTDAAGIGTTVSFDNVPLTTTSGTVSEAEIGGNPVLQLTLPALPNSLGAIPLQLDSLSFTIDGQAPTVSGAPSATPFTRMPTSCVTATSTLSIQTYASTSPNGGGSSSFTPTGCSGTGGLAFTPSITASATRDATDPGVTLVTTVTTNPAEAADKSLVLTVPTGTLAPDVFNAGHLFGQSVGTATAVTPLVTTPLVGTVTLTGTLSAPALAITFPPPFALSFSGSVNIVNNSVTFASVPDVPLNSLTLKLEGGPTSLFYTTCAQPDGTLQAAFVGQNGVSAPTTAPIDVTGCPKPARVTLSGGTAGGFASGSAKLGFGLTAGTSAKLVSFTVSLPSGVTFNAKAFKRGLSLSGAKIRSASVHGGRLSVKLKSPAVNVGVTLSPDALLESKSLQKKVKAHKLKSLSAKIVVKDTGGVSTTLPLQLQV